MNNEIDPHSQLRTTSQPCQIHKKHIPASHVNHRHHVWPLGMGGPDIEDNIIVVCPTGHYGIHDLMSFFRIHRGDVPYSVLRRYTHQERHFAELGFKRAQRKSM